MTDMIEKVARAIGFAQRTPHDRSKDADEFWCNLTQRSQYALRVQARAAIEAMRPILEEAYLLGFQNSGEGWNGEWPFEGVDPKTDEDWVSARDEALAALTANTNPEGEQ